MVPWLPLFFPRLHAPLFWNHKLIFFELLRVHVVRVALETVCYQMWPIPGSHTPCQLQWSMWPSRTNQNQPPWPGTIRGASPPHSCTPEIANQVKCKLGGADGQFCSQVEWAFLRMKHFLKANWLRDGEKECSRCSYASVYPNLSLKFSVILDFKKSFPKSFLNRHLRFAIKNVLHKF